MQKFVLWLICIIFTIAQLHIVHASYASKNFVPGAPAARAVERETKRSSCVACAAGKFAASTPKMRTDKPFYDDAVKNVRDVSCRNCIISTLKPYMMIIFMHYLQRLRKKEQHFSTRIDRVEKRQLMLESLIKDINRSITLQPSNITFVSTNNLKLCALF